MKEYFSKIFLLTIMLVTLLVVQPATAEEIASKGCSLPDQGMTQADGKSKQAIDESYGKLPLTFVRNDGQLDERVEYYQKGSGHSTYFTKDGVYLSLSKGVDPGVEAGEVAKAEYVKLAPVGLSKQATIVAEELQEGRVNYYRGNDPSKWQSGIPTYRSVVYKGVYPGVDIRFYGDNRQLEYDIIVEPGVDTSVVELSYENAEGLSITEAGELEVAMKHGSIVHKKPYIYQDIDGKRNVIDGKFVLFGEKVAKNGKKSLSYGFQVAFYDKSRDLVIDPVIIYSTYLGGDGNDVGISIAVDLYANAYILGSTYSTDFPLANPVQSSLGAGAELFVSKLNSSGTTLVYSTYLGGGSTDYGFGIDVDSAGNAVVVGQTSSSDFPTLNAVQGTYIGNGDIFITKFDPNGALLFSTFYGGTSTEEARAVAVDNAGNAYITGLTYSSDFTTVAAIDDGCESCGAGWYNGGPDVIVVKLDPSGSIVYSTYWGSPGDGLEMGNAIAVDAAGNVYVAGETKAETFPTINPLQEFISSSGSTDGFVFKINSAGDAVDYSTYLGGTGGNVVVHDIAVDNLGNAIVVGYTTAGNFPTFNALQPVLAGGKDVFVTKITADGSAFVYSTFLGTQENDIARGVAVDYAGNAYVTGYSGSANFPLFNEIQSHMGWYDVFVTKYSTDGQSILFSTFIGGTRTDKGFAIDLDLCGNPYITGETDSTDFNLVNPLQATIGVGTDAFVIRLVD